MSAPNHEAVRIFFRFAGCVFLLFGTLKLLLVFSGQMEAESVDPVIRSIRARSLVFVTGVVEEILGAILLASTKLSPYGKALVVFATSCTFVAYRMASDVGTCNCAGLLHRLVPEQHQALLDGTLKGILAALLMGSTGCLVAESKRLHRQESKER